MKRTLILLLMIGSSLAYADRYVAPTNAGSAPDYESWAKAATNIQDAVNAAAAGCASVTVWWIWDVMNLSTLAQSSVYGK